jgi:hypothetical protein
MTSSSASATRSSRSAPGAFPSWSDLSSAAELVLAGAGRVLAIGIGGGGDVAGALAVAILCERLGTGCEVGGLSWERRVVDPLPGPRLISEIAEAKVLDEFAALAGPRTSGPGGFRFAESAAAEAVGRPTVLIDPNGGPAGAAAGIGAASARLGCDTVVLLDVGGDVLAHGDEPGLASPLADAVLLAAAPALKAGGLSVLGAVFGAGCDGELTPAEVAARLAEAELAGAALGSSVLSPAELDRLEPLVAPIPTEASAMAIRCARGERGGAEIRGGRRHVELTELGGQILWFDPDAALASTARLARAVAGAHDLESAEQVLRDLGVRSELAYERDAAAAPP